MVAHLGQVSLGEAVDQCFEGVLVVLVQQHMLPLLVLHVLVECHNTAVPLLQNLVQKELPANSLQLFSVRLFHQ